MTLKIDSNYKKYSEQKEWHTWFAWFPIRVSNDEVIWLQAVERKRQNVFGDWEYKKLS